jgi:hypothetical protein
LADFVEKYIALRSILDMGMEADIIRGISDG